MADVYLDPGGIIVPYTTLSIARAKEFAAVLASGALNFVRLVECRSQTDDGRQLEAVIIDVDVQRTQRRRFPIRRTERIAAIFSAADDGVPEVLALREDFPWVPHTNLRLKELPRSLCLYEESWAEVELRWTPSNFIERLRHWLSATARGALHGDDQPLEPILFGSGYKLVLPADLFDKEANGPDELEIFSPSSAESSRVFVALRPQGKKAEGLQFLALSFVAQPRAHGVIRHSPTNLAQLEQFLSEGGVHAIDEIKRSVLAWKEKGWIDKKLMLIVAFPKTREGGAAIETSDIWCFLTTSTIREIGIAVGVWEKRGEDLAYVMGGVPGADGKEIPVEVVTPVFDFSREKAAALCGVPADDRKVVAIGVGALGSQIASNLARSGFGSWTMVDEDHFLPHNLARHALDGRGIGFSKALGMAVQVGRLYDSKLPAEWIPADVLRPGEHAERLNGSFTNAELILDMAASVPVSRHLALDVSSTARRLSIFLNPQGTDLVVLAEDEQRSLSLDVLEMEYLQAVATHPSLESHLAAPNGRIRYARSCRDVSVVLPNHLVGLHAAIGSNAARRSVAAPGASIQIWQADPESLAVSYRSIDPRPVFRGVQLGWTLVIDSGVAERMAALREGKLPNETGGVLLGSFDLKRRIVYVVDTLPSPPDSKEWPTLYIRGSEGLAAAVKEIGKRTDGQLEYVGEWHSHPRNCSCQPSDDDLLVFSWLVKNMSDAGYPALMAIAGDAGSNWFLGEMRREGGWNIIVAG